MKDAINTSDITSMFLLSITWNHCHCAEDRVGGINASWGRGGEDRPLHHPGGLAGRHLDRLVL